MSNVPAPTGSPGTPVNVVGYAKLPGELENEDILRASPGGYSKVGGLPVTASTTLQAFNLNCTIEVVQVRNLSANAAEIVYLGFGTVAAAQVAGVVDCSLAVAAGETLTIPVRIAPGPSQLTVIAASGTPSVLVRFAGHDDLLPQGTLMNRVFKTGEIKSLVVGDDGFYQAGIPHIAQRYTDVGNLRVDNETGLMWVKSPWLMMPNGDSSIQGNFRGPWGNLAADAPIAYGDIVNGAGAAKQYACILATTKGATDPADDATHFMECNLAAGAYLASNLPGMIPKTWPLTIAWINGLRYGGYADWRMPNIREAMSLPFDISAMGSQALSTGCLNASTGFGWINPNNRYLWLSTTVAKAAADSAWLLRYEDGIGVSQAKTATNAGTLLVRGPVI